ncbi:radical SAM protein [Nonomuraea sp. NPDC005650]|uniref:radical SAM protein n=1 Tax=Nonomuraea sp. NPDC005650 TaxID=3157045 RepID=UPI0033A0EE0D
MHLAEIAALRPVPAAGLQLALTRRCPLSCAHCSTDSSIAAEQHSGTPFRTLVASFTHEHHPEVILMSGGEPLLRPGLVADLATRAREAGTRSFVLSGMFFARPGRAVPPAIDRALSRVDHVGASVDAHHEREVGRGAVFEVLHRLAGRVPAVSLHVTGGGDDDEYVAGLVADIRREFGDRVPILVTRIQPTGRARHGPPRASAAPVMPCAFAAWPLVSYDGTVFGCCRQSLLESERPRHLVLGHAARDGWEALAAKAAGDPVLRALRLMGPVAVRRRFGAGPALGTVCATCVTLSGDADLRRRVADYLESPAGRALATLARPEIEHRDPYRVAAGWGSPRYRELIGLGWEGAKHAQADTGRHR